MIKVIKKPKKYAQMVKVSKEACTDPVFMKSVLSDLKIKRYPKNTLKVVRLKTFTGLDRDDFVKNLLTVRLEFFIYTFKR